MDSCNLNHVICIKKTVIELPHANKYYFIKEVHRSYPFLDLLQRSIGDFFLLREKIAKKSPSYQYRVPFSLNTPKGKCYRTLHLNFYGSVANPIRKIIATIRENYFIDWSKSANQTTCPISQEKFEDPYILNVNGKSYSKRSIKTAIKTTLCENKPLRLEDLTIQPSELKNIVLYSNRTLWKKPATLKFDSKK